MIQFTSSTQSITLYTQAPEHLLNSVPLLYINMNDGWDKTQRASTLKKYLNADCEWFISYGPDALLWQYTAESCFLDQFDFHLPDDKNFTAFAYDDEQPISRALHQLTEFSSHANDNKPYESFNIIAVGHDQSLIEQIHTHLKTHKFTPIESPEELESL